MIEPLTQTVEIPLWLLLVFLAYSETRIGKATGGLKRLKVSRQSEASDEPEDEGDSSSEDENRTWPR